jgi:hypothetical protein
LSVSPDKQKNVSQRSLQLRGECKHFYALLNNLPCYVFLLLFRNTSLIER